MIISWLLLIMKFGFFMHRQNESKFKYDLFQIGEWIWLYIYIRNFAQLTKICHVSFLDLWCLSFCTCCSLLTLAWVCIFCFRSIFLYFDTYSCTCLYSDTCTFHSCDILLLHKLLNMMKLTSGSNLRSLMSDGEQKVAFQATRSHNKSVKISRALK